MPSAPAETMRDRIPDAELITYAGMPHNIGDADPARSVADLIAFLERRG